MKRKAPNYIPALLLIVAVVVLSAVCGFYAFRPEKEIIQGEVEVTEYRVSSKVPGRVAKSKAPTNSGRRPLPAAR